MLIMENDDLKALSVQLGCATDDTLHTPQELDLSLPDVQSEHPLSLLQQVKL